VHKRENFRRAFRGFDFRKVAKFGPAEKRRLMKDEGIVRNRLKIESAVVNARRFLEVRREFGTFSRYMWGWVGGKPQIHRMRSLKDYKPYTQEALDWAKDLKERGFKFLGPTVLYAHMQGVGMVNDHVVGCFRYKEVMKAVRKVTG
jgi:DNA-3-methyladenine glycosylase I